MLHAAKIDNSARLQRVLELLLDGLPHTTREIVRNADVCAVNSCISEIRANGYEITCRQIAKGRYQYRIENQQDSNSITAEKF